MKRPIFFVLVCVAVLCVSARVSCQSPDPLDGFAELVDSLRTNWRTRGVAVAVVKDGEVIFSEGFGYRDLETHLPVTSQTVFSIGSVTKSFTALAAALLVDDGSLALDTPILQMVSDFALLDECAKSRGTMRDLLSHRMGFSAYLDHVWLLGDLSRSELFARLHSVGTTAGFRERFQYSNVGYATAGTVIERLSGVRWETFVADRILLPLGMKRSGFSLPDLNQQADVALPYRVEDGWPVRVPFVGSIAFERVEVVGPAGSLRSTADDLAQWALLHLPGGPATAGRGLVSDTMLRELHAPQNAVRDPGYRLMIQADVYGFGWALSHYRGHRVVSHGGNIEGFSALVSLLPDLDLGVVVLSNTLDFLGYVLSRNVYDRFLGEAEMDWDTPMRTLFSQITAANGLVRVPPAPVSDLEIDARLSFFTGSFEHPIFGTVVVTAGDDGLDLTFASGLRSTLLAVGDNSFWGSTDEFYVANIRVLFGGERNGIPEELRIAFAAGAEEFVFRRTRE